MGQAPILCAPLHSLWCPAFDRCVHVCVPARPRLGALRKTKKGPQGLRSLSLSGLSLGPELSSFLSLNHLAAEPSLSRLKSQAQQTCLNVLSDREGSLQGTLFSVALPDYSFRMGGRESGFPWQSSLKDRSGKPDWWGIKRKRRQGA